MEELSKIRYRVFVWDGFSDDSRLLVHDPFPSTDLEELVWNETSHYSVGVSPTIQYPAIKKGIVEYLQNSRMSKTEGLYHRQIKMLVEDKLERLRISEMCSILKDRNN